MKPSLCLSLLLIASCVNAGPAAPYVPVEWKDFVQVEGQPLPVPVQWLDTEEAQVAHSLKLPESVPKPVPFDFTQARMRALVPGQPNVTVQYFKHLCSTESGEWIFEGIDKVEGFYEARPRLLVEDQYLRDPFGPEAPWIERHFRPFTVNLNTVGERFVSPPQLNYRYIEQPVTDAEWQKASGIQTGFVRVGGLTRGYFVKSGQVVPAWNELNPMRATAINVPLSKYAYTWRGIRRERDRDLHIAGGELLIYERASRKVVAVRRTFEATDGRSLWLLGPTCRETPDEVHFLTLTEFALRVLPTIEPSTTGRK